MTTKEIREVLPYVRVSVKGKVCNGKVIGRLMSFPRVYVPEIDTEYTFSWEAITRAINKDSVLKV